MRTSILGVHDFNSLDKVIDNTVNVSKCTNVDPRYLRAVFISFLTVTHSLT